MVSGTVSLKNGTIVACDPVAQRYSLATSDGESYSLRDQGDELRLERQQKKVGAIVRGSRSSGSIWINGQCIGEYALADDNYRVIPIKNGFREPGEMVHIHPVDFLIEHERRTLMQT